MQKWYTYYTIKGEQIDFEFDAKKSKENKGKHGIDFIEAQQLWDCPKITRFPAQKRSERRHMFVGTVRNQHYSVVCTQRNGRIRIISARPSTRKEVQRHEAHR